MRTHTQKKTHMRTLIQCNQRRGAVGRVLYLQRRWIHNTTSFERSNLDQKKNDISALNTHTNAIISPQHQLFPFSTWREWCRRRQPKVLHTRIPPSESPLPDRTANAWNVSCLKSKTKQKRNAKMNKSKSMWCLPGAVQNAQEYHAAAPRSEWTAARFAKISEEKGD